MSDHRSLRGRVVAVEMDHHRDAPIATRLVMSRNEHDDGRVLIREPRSWKRSMLELEEERDAAFVGCRPNNA